MRTLLALAALAILCPAEEAPRDSRFGIDYVFVHGGMYDDPVWAETLAKTGAGWVNFAGLSWQHTEPAPPRDGRHRYDWSAPDRLVAQWQGRGFRIAFSLRLGNGWFAGPIRYRPDLSLPLGDKLLEGSDRLPSPEHMESFRAWIRALVERYDGDGKDDAPGVRCPVLHYQVGNEYSNPAFWTGTLEDYKTLLETLATAAREACPGARIVSNGIRWNDLFHRDPEAKLLEERFAAFLKGLPSDGWREAWRRAREICEGTVALAGSYDILDAGGNGPYPTMSVGYMTWVRRELAAKGLETTIWDMESRCEPVLSQNAVAGFHKELEVPGGVRLLAELKAAKNPRHEAAVAWYRAEQSRVLAQVFVTRFAAGFEKVFMGMPSDWDASLGALATPNPYLGLCDRKAAPWPALRAMALLVEELDGFAEAERVTTETEAELYRFRLEGGRPVRWVAWLPEEKTRGQADPLPSQKVLLEAVRRPVTLRLVPTTSVETPLVQLEPGAEGLSIELTPTPVILAERE